MKPIIFKTQKGRSIIINNKFAILASLVLVASLFLNSCKKSNENNNEMKPPTEAGTTNQESSEQKAISVEQAKVKTVANMQEAFNGESNATARYAAFSKKAEILRFGHKTPLSFGRHKTGRHAARSNFRTAAFSRGTRPGRAGRGGGRSRSTPPAAEFFAAPFRSFPAPSYCRRGPCGSTGGCSACRRRRRAF